MSDSLERDIRRYYVFSFLLGTYIASGVTVLFQLRIGLTYSEIFLIEAVYMLSFILFEVPSGALADLIGRKKTILLGTALIAIGAITTGLSDRFWQVFASNFSWAFGFSCLSGANEALLYDRIGDEERYGRVIGKSGLLALVGSAGAGILGPQLFTLDFRWPYLVSAIPFLLAGAAISGFFEEPKKTGFTAREHVRKISEGSKFAFRDPFLRWSSLLLALLFASSYTMASLYQPYLEKVGFSIGLFSVIVPAMAVIGGLGAASSPVMSSRLKETPFVLVVVVAVGASVLVMASIFAPVSLAALLAFTFFQGTAKPFLSVYANRRIASEERATVLSVQSMIATTAASLPLFVLGSISDRFGLETSLLVLGIGAIISGLVLVALKPRDRA